MLSATYKKINFLADTNQQKKGKMIAYLFARDIMFVLKNPHQFFFYRNQYFSRNHDSWKLIPKQNFKATHFTKIQETTGGVRSSKEKNYEQTSNRGYSFSETCKRKTKNYGKFEEVL